MTAPAHAALPPTGAGSPSPAGRPAAILPLATPAPPNVVIHRYSCCVSETATLPDGMSLTFHKYPVAGTTLTVAGVGEDADDDTFDPNFFDEGYSLAAQTAYSVWEGAAFLLEFLQRGLGSDASVEGARIAGEIRRLIGVGEHIDASRPPKLVELGSGTGAAGLGLALLGADALLTDVASVVPSIRDNVQRNQSAAAREPGLSSWRAADALPVGKQGHAAAQTLNWMLPLDRQCAPVDPRSARVLLATETTWLRELVDPFVATSAALLASPLSPEPELDTPLSPVPVSVATPHDLIQYLFDRPTRKFMLWVYKERGTAASQTFTTFPLVKGVFEGCGCRVHTVHREASREDPNQFVRVNLVVFGASPFDADHNDVTQVGPEVAA
ncbi:hypothetical protein H9P43_007077 [Blastocladiella emersonii ATCC 22665]|nr:hypothetical protein H9P43_007077 [Blastocladiella emersonii ATCC 22665]